MPIVTAVVKANTVLFMSLTLSGLSEPLTGGLRKRFQSRAVGSEFERTWQVPWKLTERHLCSLAPLSAAPYSSGWQTTLQQQWLA